MKTLNTKQMSRVLLALSLSLVVLGAAMPARAGGGPFGLGIVLGDPTALTGKYNTGNSQAYDFGVSFDLSRWTLLYADWHYRFPGAFHTANGFLNQLIPYVGVGGIMVFSNQDTTETRKQRYFNSTTDSKFALGARIPLGIEWTTSKIPLGVFVELVPGLVVIPNTTSFTNAGIGVRYFF